MIKMYSNSFFYNNFSLKKKKQNELLYMCIVNVFVYALSRSLTEMHNNELIMDFN